MNSGTPVDFSKPLAEEEGFSASTPGSVQAAKLVAEKEIPFSKPVRTGGDEIGLESEEEDSERQQQLTLAQAQQSQIAACAFAVNAGPENAAGSRMSNRVKRMASVFFTEER